MKIQWVFCRWRRAAVLALAVAMLCAVGCGGKENEGRNTDAYEISYWIPKGEDSTYYGEYNDNPVVKYIEENYKFNGKPIHFSYYVAPVGSESDNFNILLSTGEYCDIMDLSMSSESAVQMYEDGYVQDLTELVPQHMPNYMAYLEKNPELKQEIYSIVDGEKRILSIIGFNDGVVPNFEGFCYRRDWIAKYGSNPFTGEKFSYGFEDANDPYSWSDNVVFPSGGNEPVYISDWEWMFEIFDLALEDLGIKDGYGYAPYFQGYMQTGDLASAFGGGNSCYWYRNLEGEAVFGPTTDCFRAYLQCLNTWYKKGWIDKAFAEHNGDIFYAVDSAKVFSGKVGLWQGRQSTVGTQIDAGDAYTNGAVVYGCRQPINDKYGSEEAKNKEPYVFYQPGRTTAAVTVTTNLTKEETVAFLEYVDFLFSEEGAELALGLNKAQYEASQDEVYARFGMTEGAYVKENGRYRYYMDFSDPLKTALSLERIACKLGLVENMDYNFDRYLEQATDAWAYYEKAQDIFAGSIANAMSIEDAGKVSNIRNNVDQFMIRSVSAIIMGKGYDVWDDAGWEQFKKDINKYQPQTVTDIYNTAIDLLEK